MINIEAFTIPEVIEKSGREFAGRPFLGMIGAEPVGYSELEPRTKKLAALLGLYGIAKGDRVALVGESRPEWGISYLGASRAGAVLVPILNDFMPEQMKNIIEHAGAKLILTSRKLQPKIAEASQGRIVLAIEDLALISGPADAIDVTSSGGKARLEAALASWKPVPVSADDLAAIVYTSGTTGLSKGVMLSHRNLVWDAWSCRGIIVIKPEDRFLSVLPLAHTYEFTIGFLIPLMQGSVVWYLDKPPTATALLPAFAKVKPTCMLTVPLIIEKVYRASVAPTLAGMGLYKVAAFKPLLERVAGFKLMKTFGGKMRFYGIGGAPLAEDVESFLRHAKFPYAVGYGLTETSPMLAGSNPQIQGFRYAGPALKGCEVRIADPRPDTGEGEIQVRGPNVFSGYYRDEERTREAFSDDGWFRTGDLGYVDAKEHIAIRGRIKTMILGASGENIYPEEIEAVINASPHVAESLVYGDEKGLTALIHLKPEVLEELAAKVKSSLAGAGHAASAAGHAAGQKAGEAFHSVEQAAAQLLESIKKEANSRLTAFSRIGRVERQEEPFEKTPKQSIKRFLYPKKRTS
ncbi:MAG TPA: AMP-binding protein [Rectinemataceae bacterium]|nr:AMP-binding protein [Rectinemataceae bacterium]